VPLFPNLSVVCIFVTAQKLSEGDVISKTVEGFSLTAAFRIPSATMKEDISKIQRVLLAGLGGIVLQEGPSLDPAALETDAAASAQLSSPSESELESDVNSDYDSDLSQRLEGRTRTSVPSDAVGGAGTMYSAIGVFSFAINLSSSSRLQAQMEPPLKQPLGIGKFHQSISNQTRSLLPRPSWTPATRAWTG